MLKGIDVSQVQGRIDWLAVKRDLGISFAIAKAVEGNKNAPDPMLAANVAGARGAGVTIGGYFFAYPLPPNGQPNRAAADQAQHMFDLSGGLGGRSGDLPPALDLEWPEKSDWAQWGCTDRQIRTWGLDWLEAAEALWGVAPIVYTYPQFAVDIGLASEPRYARYLLWMASYPSLSSWPSEGSTPPITAKPWSKATIWQTSDGTWCKLPNGKEVDTDVFVGDEAELRTLCYRPGAPISNVVPITPDMDPPTPPDDLPPAA